MDINLPGMTSGTVSPSVTSRPNPALEKNIASHLNVEKSSYVSEGDKVSRAKVVNEAEETTASKLDKEEQSQADALAEVVKQLSEVVSLMNKGLAFSVDEDSGAAVVKVMDIDSGEIIRQIPSDEALELAQKLQDVKGLLMRTEA